jgi:hypothetical protein
MHLNLLGSRREFNSICDFSYIGHHFFLETSRTVAFYLPFLELTNYFRGFDGFGQQSRNLISIVRLPNDSTS